VAFTIHDELGLDDIAPETAIKFHSLAEDRVVIVFASEDQCRCAGVAHVRDRRPLPDAVEVLVVPAPIPLRKRRRKCA